MPVLVGTSGWQYADWRGGLYPKHLATAGWLAHYAARFATVEVNNAFYRLPERATFTSWAEQTPDDFVVAVKASRFLTHVRRLKDPAEPVARLLDHAGGLGDKLGPVLLQLPPNLRADAGLLDAALECFPDGVKVAVEPRDESWFVERVRRVLEARGAALCLADRPGWHTPLWRTARFGYVRFHEGRASPHPCYGRRALEHWGERLCAWWPEGAEVFAYFNNDHGGCAPRDAGRLAHQVTRAGGQAGRAPSVREVPLGLGR